MNRVFAGCSCSQWFRAAVLAAVAVAWRGPVFASVEGTVEAALPEAPVTADTGPAPEPAPPPVPVADEPDAGGAVVAVEQALTLLQDHHLDGDAEQQTRAILRAILRGADERAQVFRDAGDRAPPDPLTHGAGIVASRSNGVTAVIQVVADSPAAASGIEVGDQILEVDSVEAGALNMAQLMRRLHGDAAREVALLVARGDDEPEQKRIEILPVSLPALAEYRVLPGNLGYLRVLQLDASAGSAVADVLREWADEEVDGAILDLRGAGGHDLDSVIEVASLVVAPGETLFTFRDARDQDISVHRATETEALGMPIMVLVDDGTRAASEVLAASLSGSGRGAMIIGERTAGDPLIREYLPVTTGHVAYLATRRLVVADGTVYAGSESVEPDIVVEPTAALIEYDPAPPILTDHREVTETEIATKELREWITGDVPMIRAVDILLGLRALNIHGFGYAR